MGMTVKVTINSTDGFIPLKKEYTHKNVMALIEESERYVLLLPETKLIYSKKYYGVK